MKLKSILSLANYLLSDRRAMRKNNGGPPPCIQFIKRESRRKERRLSKETIIKAMPRVRCSYCHSLKYENDELFERSSECLHPFFPSCDDPLQYQDQEDDLADLYCFDYCDQSEQDDEWEEEELFLYPIAGPLAYQLKQDFYDYD